MEASAALLPDASASGLLPHTSSAALLPDAYTVPPRKSSMRKIGAEPYTGDKPFQKILRSLSAAQWTDPAFPPEFKSLCYDQAHMHYKPGTTDWSTLKWRRAKDIMDGKAVHIHTKV